MIVKKSKEWYCYGHCVIVSHSPSMIGKNSYPHPTSAQNGLFSFIQKGLLAHTHSSVVCTDCEPWWCDLVFCKWMRRQIGAKKLSNSLLQWTALLSLWSLHSYDYSILTTITFDGGLCQHLPGMPERICAGLFMTVSTIWICKWTLKNKYWTR